MVIQVDSRRIEDWDSFHDVFVEVLGLPAYYGRNMDALIDIMTRLDDPTGADTRVTAPAGEIVVLQLDRVDEFVRRCPEQYDALVECSAFVNYRRIAMGLDPILALSFYQSHPRRTLPSK